MKINPYIGNQTYLPLKILIMSDYEITTCDERFFLEHAKEFTDLCVRAFAEHLKNNVRMGPCFMTIDKWLEWSKNCVGQCVFDKKCLIAFWMVRPNYQSKVADGRILAVSPEYKGQHIGQTLTFSLIDYLKKIGMNVFVTDTSKNAPHVIKFHKSYGCKVVGLTSWPNTNYYSVLLRLGLQPEFDISDEEANRRFKRSSFWCKLMLKEDGRETLLKKILKKLKNN